MIKDIGCLVIDGINSVKKRAERNDNIFNHKRIHPFLDAYDIFEDRIIQDENKIKGIILCLMKTDKNVTTKME